MNPLITQVCGVGEVLPALLCMSAAAHSHGPSPLGDPPATGTGTLLITLEDVNDNAPFIYPTAAEVCDDAKNLSVVILGASDKDLHPNTDPFKFEIYKQAVPDKVWKVSKINSKSAERATLILVALA